MSNFTEAQLAERRSGIGGSDIAAICGVDPYRSPWNVFAEKLGIVEPAPSNRFTRWGTKLEAVIASEYAERNDVILGTCETQRSEKHPWMFGTPDRLVYAAGGNPLLRTGRLNRPDWGLEIKNKGFFQSTKWGEDGADAETVPEEVRIQSHWYMELTAAPRWDIAALIGGNDYREYTLAADAELQGMLVDIGEKFWRDHVLAKVPPTYDGSEAAWSHLGGLFKPTAKPLDVGPEAQRLAAAIRAARQLVAAGEQGKAENEQQLAALIIEAGATYADGGDWRFTLGTRAGSPAWKAIAMALVERYNVSPEALNDLEAKHRGPTQMATRWTDRTGKSKETKTP